MFVQCKLVILILVMTLDGQGEIYGGQKAVPHSRPYMVLLEMDTPEGQIKYCGGFLLNEKFVMTAAHCQASEFGSYEALLGVHDINKKEVQRVSVEEKFPHENYDYDKKNDIMLLKLSSKASFNKNVKPIPLAGRGDVSRPKSCIVSGWGRTDRKIGYMSDVLMEVNVTLIDNELCDKDNLYCSEGDIGPSAGDSGGPLVCEDEKAYGVVSFTFKPHTGDRKIHGFTKIPDFRKWIDNIMKKHGKR